MSALINSLTKALNADPADWETRSSLAEVLLGAGRKEDAQKLLAEAGDIPASGSNRDLAVKAYVLAGLDIPAPSPEPEDEDDAEVEAIAVLVDDDGDSDDEQLLGAVAIVEPDEEDEIVAQAPPPPVPTPLAPPKAEPVREPILAAEPVLSATGPVDDKEEDNFIEPSTDVPEPAKSEVAAASDVGGRSVPPMLEEAGDKRAFIVVESTTQDLEELHQMEAISEAKHARALKRDRFNSVVLTFFLHVALFVGLAFIVTSLPEMKAPQIVAMAGPVTEEDTLDPKQVTKPQPRQTSSAAAITPKIVTVEAFSSVSLSNMDLQVSSPRADFGVTYSPSFDMGMPSGASMMLFGEKLLEDGETLGVILDVSGSMAEYLPRVIREIDRNFPKAPIVYVHNALIRGGGAEVEVRTIVEEEVVPYYEDRTHTPYWFIWYDLPRKAPQPAVDRLLEFFKKRPNSFITVGGYNRIEAAADFLIKQKVDGIYVFSDFEDFVDPELVLAMGQRAGSASVKGFVQPAQQETEYLKVMTQRFANRSKGRELAPLQRIPEEEPKGLLAALDDDTSMNPETVEEKLGVKYAKPRAEMAGTTFYEFRPAQDWFEVARLEEPEYDVVFYGPEARGEIFLKSPEGYIQYPITFGYHSWKDVQAEDPQVRYRRRKFLRLEEQPTFDGQEIVWKMVLEDELPFEVHLYIDRKGMNATYVAEPPTDGTNDAAYIYFRVPPLVVENKDRYYGYDLPDAGLDLDGVREFARLNKSTLNLPGAERDRFGSSWSELGFEPGYNVRPFNVLIRNMPNGIRDMVVEGPSFGPRKFHARTTSSRILLSGGSHRADIEMWEGFHARLIRPADRRTRFTKTEAIAIMIE